MVRTERVQIINSALLLQRLLACFAFLSLYIVTVNANAEEVKPGFTTKKVTTVLEENIYYIDIDSEYVLSDKVADAIGRGVKIVIAVDMIVFYDRWYGAHELVSLKQRYAIKYHVLSKKYLLINENSGDQEAFFSIDSIIYRLQNISKLPLVDKSVLPENKKLLVKVRSSLELDSLPLSVRALSYFSSDWSLDSNWSTWSLEK
ncbi:MAG: DUF4390 domain-containing protein [Gammaproteobacteria bacterium]|nr:MAG: DUF4390 domain-containing protein [Gammaproteobacteria bacterium]